MSYLIVGLGNIGVEYTNTRHNIGFMVVDSWAQLSTISFSTDRLGSVANFRFRGEKVTLLKPSTYMNLSGRSVNYWLQKEKVPIEKLLVIADDISLPLGTTRLRKQGSDGGHNGLRDITATLGSNKFARLRVGIGGRFGRGGQVDYVLGEWEEEEREYLPKVIERGIEVSKSFMAIGVERTMNIYNSKDLNFDFLDSEEESDDE